VRSEGVAVIFIQKKNVARRAYASILNVRNNTDGFKDKGVTFPSGKMQNELLRETYAQVGVDPSDLTYFEAHGTGTKAGDPQELNSVSDFSKDRTTPLLIGSVKSNVGHLEPVAG
jgi:fatty acid synthase